MYVPENSGPHPPEMRVFLLISVNRKDLFMALFVVQHRHNPDSCPASDPIMAPLLLAQLSEQNARRLGVAIRSEAVVNGAHTLYLTVEAANRESVERLMKPFAEVGTIEIQAASHCEAVVERGGC